MKMCKAGFFRAVVLRRQIRQLILRVKRVMVDG